MASKVKPTQKTETKVDAKAEAKAKLAAERAKLVEKLVPKIVKPIAAGLEAQAKVSFYYEQTVEAVAEATQENSLSRSESKELIELAICEAHNIELKDLKTPKHISLQGYISRVNNLANPKNEEIAKEIEKARAMGAKVTDLHKVASGGMKAKDAIKSLGKGGNVKKKSQEKQKHGKGVIEDIDKGCTEIIAVVARCVEGGCDPEELNEKILSTLADYFADNAAE